MLRYTINVCEYLVPETLIGGTENNNEIFRDHIAATMHHRMFLLANCSTIKHTMVSVMA